MGRALEGTVTVAACATPITSLAGPGRPVAGVNRAVCARIAAVAAPAVIIRLADGSDRIRGPATRRCRGRHGGRGRGPAGRSAASARSRARARTQE